MKKIGIACLLFIGQLLSVAQNNDYISKVKLPSLQTQLYEKYVNCPVSYETGIPSITIPLYEIEIDGLKVPLNLTYHASGIKYQQYDGDVGVGWVLNPGYRISRLILGNPDEAYPRHPDADDHTKIEIMANRLGGLKGDRYLAGFGPRINGYPMPEGKDYDGEYDQYTYLLPTGSGHFIFPNGKNEGLELETGRNNITRQAVASAPFMIKDDNDFTYTFGGDIREFTQTMQYSMLDAYPSAWPLVKMSSRRKKEIKFGYIKGQENHYNSAFGAVTIHDYASNPRGVGESDFYVMPSPNAYYYRNNVFLLDNISSDEEDIKIYREIDLLHPDKNRNKIKSIEIFRKIAGVRTFFKKIIFRYLAVNQHYMLDKVEVYNSSSQLEKTYAMTYYEGALATNSFPDQWGYYSSTGQTSVIGSQFFHSEFSSDQMQQFRNGIQTVGNKLFYLRNRRENSSSALHGYSLKSISFPTKGKWEFEYEPNQFIRNKNQLPVKGGGQRIKKISMYDSPNSKAKILEYKYGENESGNATISFDPEPRHFAEVGNKITCQEIYINPSNAVYYLVQSGVRRYSTKMLGSANIDSHFTLYYPEVAEYSFDERTKAYNGKIVRKYQTFEPKFTLGIRQGVGESVLYTNNNHGAYIGSYNYGMKIFPKAVSYYSSVFNNFNLIREEKFEYKKTPNNKTYFGFNIKVETIVVGTSIPIYSDSDISTLQNPYNAVGTLFSTHGYTINTGTYLLIKQTETDYLSGSRISKVSDYTYNAKHQISSVTESINRLDPVTKRYKYAWEPNDNSWSRENYIKEIRNQHGTSVSAEFYRYTSILKLNNEPITVFGGLLTSQNNTKDPSFNKPVYQWKGAVYPIYIWDYDKYGNPSDSFELDENVHNTYIWAYKGCYQIAHIQNVESSVVMAHKDISALVNKADQNLLSDTEMHNLSKMLRERFPSSIVNVFLYNTLGQVKEKIDPRGLTTYYEYDSSSRLKRIKDHSGNILEEYHYNYRNQ